MLAYTFLDNRHKRKWQKCTGVQSRAPLYPISHCSPNERGTLLCDHRARRSTSVPKFCQMSANFFLPTSRQTRGDGASLKSSEGTKVPRTSCAVLKLATISTTRLADWLCCPAWPVDLHCSSAVEKRGPCLGYGE